MSEEIILTNLTDRLGRVYSKEEIQSNLDYNNCEFLGEIGFTSEMELSIDKISHKIYDLRIDEDNNLVGKAFILNTPNGNIIKELQQEGIKVKYSMNGYGLLDDNNCVTEYTLVSINAIPAAT